MNSTALADTINSAKEQGISVVCFDSDSPTSDRSSYLSTGNSEAGRIAAEAACPCPPGIPVVMPGEIITPEAAEFLKSYGFFTIKVLK